MRNEKFDKHKYQNDPKQTNGRSPLARSFGWLLVLLIVTIIITVIRQKNEQPDVQLIQSTATTFPMPSATAPPPQTPTDLPPTATEQAIIVSSPTPFPLIENLKNGLMILSITEAGYSHLFTYNPESMSYTRLTLGEFNDIDPALSPDGSKLAFSSDRKDQFDIYILDLITGETSSISNDIEYDGHPSWSPDGLWLTYERFHQGNLDIFIQPIDLSFDPVRITWNAAADFSPSWGPDGKTIAFTSSRNGNLDIFTVDIENLGIEGYLIALTSNNEDQDKAVWSPDGSQLAWTSPFQGIQSIYIADPEIGESSARYLGVGSQAAWDPSGNYILVGIQTPLKDLIAAYPVENQSFLLLPQALPGRLEGLGWGENALETILPELIQEIADQNISANWTIPLQDQPDKDFGRQNTIFIPDIIAPYPELNAQVIESFFSLQQRIDKATGWDVLGDLENTFIPLTVKLPPDKTMDWLYTGRAFSLHPNLLPLDWMVVVREDFGENTYWRVYLRPVEQDGSQGKPMTQFPWDFEARSSSDPSDNQAGGQQHAQIPPGYWIDFTALAQDYGWERQPALSNWGQYYPGIQFNLFALTNGLSWKEAMLQLYPEEIFMDPISETRP